MKPYLKFFGVIAILAVVPFMANRLGEEQFSSAKHPVNEIVQTAAVQSKLPQGETIIWSSNIDLRRAAERAVPVGLIGIVAILLSLKCISLAPPVLAGKLYVAFCIPFVLIGIYMLTSPYWTWRNNGDSVCLLTDKRAMEIINGIVICDRRYSQMIEPSITKYSADRADVVFYIDPTLSDSESEVKSGFNGVANGDECLKILKDKLADYRKVK